MIVEPLHDFFGDSRSETSLRTSAVKISDKASTKASKRRFRRVRQNFNGEVASKTSILVGEIFCPIIPTSRPISAPSGALVDMREGLPEGALTVRKRRQRGRHSRKCLDHNHQNLTDYDRMVDCHSLCDWSSESSESDAEQSKDKFRLNLIKKSNMS